jgi:hypothetical protein
VSLHCIVLCVAMSLPQVTMASGANAPRLEPWPGGADNLWWLRGARGDADANNRGAVSNLLIVRERLGAAAVDLGPANAGVRLPERLLRADSGQLGPLNGWRLQRAPGVPITVWQVRRNDVVTGHGLLWAADAPTCATAASMRCAQQRSSWP